ncbi:hypothetical protein KAU19_04615 [Candidatus Parcubacteria bacterium]|nr:hypothetical protein [Candidatus Parcubacteria bacterium]
MEQEPTNSQMLDAINKSFGELEGKIDKRFDKVDGRLEVLEQGQEEIKLKLCNACPVK